jgi:hypothetical protein
VNIASAAYLTHSHWKAAGGANEAARFVQFGDERIDHQVPTEGRLKEGLEHARVATEGGEEVWVVLLVKE